MSSGFSFVQSAYVSVVPGDELEGLINQEHGEGELEDNHPLIEGQSRDVKNNIEDIDIQNHKVKGERQSHS